MSHLTTNFFHAHQVEQFLKAFEGNTNFYAFAADFVPGNTTPSDDHLDFTETPYASFFTAPYQSLVFGKKIVRDDIVPVIRNIPWVSGTIYNEWDDKNPVTGKDFYVVVDNVTEFYVFKCLSSPGTPSVDKPLAGDTSPEDEFYITNDGYHWKYLYTIDTSSYAKFATESFIPVIEDPEVTANAIPGTIDKIKVLDGGHDYLAVYSNTIIAENIAVDGNNTLYGIGSDSSPNTNFYVGSVIFISENVGAGQLRRITQSFTLDNKRLIVIDEPFDPLPDATSVYEITPGVEITGTGNGAIARAISNSGIITEVEVIQKGRDYTLATAVVTGNTGGETDFATLEVILPPLGGHGANVIPELMSEGFVGVSVEFANTELDTIPTLGEFKQFGILKDPIYKRVFLRDVEVISGQFFPTEEIIQAQVLLIGGVANVETFEANVQGIGTRFDQLAVDDEILVTNGTFSDLRKIDAIHSNTLITVNAEITFDSVNAQIYKIVRTLASGIVANIEPTVIEVSNSTGNFVNTAIYLLIGRDLGGVASFATIDINNQLKGYGTLDFRYLLEIANDNPLVFEPGEPITQGNTTGTIHTFDGENGLIYVTNVVGEFEPGEQLDIDGNLITLVSVREPDTVLFNSPILYLENTLAYERSGSTSELFKLIFSL